MKLLDRHNLHQNVARAVAEGGVAAFVVKVIHPHTITNIEKALALRGVDYVKPPVCTLKKVARKLDSQRVDLK